MNKMKRTAGLFLLTLCLLVPGCGEQYDSEKPEMTKENETAAAEENDAASAGETNQEPVELSEISEYSGAPYIIVNHNVPEFTEDQLTTESFEIYSELDELNRCGTAYANIGTDIMPTEKRSSIGEVKPSGWHTVKYDIVDGNYLYNRCHLIGYQLSAENANIKNLVTGTRYLNTMGMLPFENMVADYVKETGNHVMYRVTPVFEGDNLVANGVQMEAMSVEDKGDGICFNVYCYNKQPGISIDYTTGDSWLNENAETEPEMQALEKETTGTVYILNTNTYKFHSLSCPSIKQMNEENLQKYTGNREDIMDQGYAPCRRCNP